MHSFQVDDGIEAGARPPPRKLVRADVILPCIIVLGAVTWVVVELLRGEKPKYSRLVMVSTNDVYKMIGRSNNGKAWVWNGSLSTPEGRRLVEICKSPGGAEGCFPAAAVQHVGVADVLLEDVRLRVSPDGPAEPLVIEGDLGCVRGVDEIRAKSNPTFGNLLDYGQTVQLLRRTHQEEDKHTLFLNILPGDFLGPSYIASIFWGNHTLALMNEMQIDMVSFGNHDFDFQSKCDGNACVLQRMLQSTFMWLGSNTHVSKDEAPKLLGEGHKVPKTIKYNVEGEMRSLDRNSVIFDGDGMDYQQSWWSKRVGERKVCFFSTTETEAAQSAAKSSSFFTDMQESGLAILRILSKQSCQVVVMLSHQRTGYDILFWQAAVDMGLPVPDVIWGAHDHYAAFLHLEHPTDPAKMTYIWKLGADAHLLGKIILDAKGPPQLRVVPVLEGSCEKVPDGFCSRLPNWKECEGWNAQYTKTYNTYAREVKELSSKSLPIKWRGIYDTANVRVRESRASNFLLDLARIAAQTDIGILAGGSIRQDAFDPKPSEGTNLTELDLKEEFPFANGLGAVEMTLLQIHAIVSQAVSSLLKGGVSSNRAHLSGLAVIFNSSGPLNITYEGQCHIGGLLDRRKLDAGKLKCGTLLWSRQDGFGTLGRFFKLSVAASTYMLFDDSGTYVRVGGDIAEVETMCEERAMAYSSLLRKKLACSGGFPAESYYSELEDLVPCGDHFQSSDDDGLAGSCWRQLVPWRRNQPLHVVHWRMEESLTEEIEPFRELFATKPCELFSTALIRSAKDVSWEVGLETRAELRSRGIEAEELVILPFENLYVQRMLSMDLKIKQERLQTLLEAKDWAIATEELTEIVRSIFEEIEHRPEHMSDAIQEEVNQLQDWIAKQKKSEVEVRSLRTSNELPLRVNSLLDSFPNFCRAAHLLARGHQPEEDGRALLHHIGSLCQASTRGTYT